MTERHNDIIKNIQADGQSHREKEIKTSRQREITERKKFQDKYLFSKVLKRKPRTLEKPRRF